MLATVVLAASSGGHGSVTPWSYGPVRVAPDLTKRYDLMELKRLLMAMLAATLVLNGCNDDDDDEQPPAPVAEIHAILLAHLEDLYAFYGLETGVKVARKHISWYTKGLIGSAAFRKIMNTLPTVEQQRGAVDDFFLRYAEEHEHLQYEDNKTQEEALAA